MGSRRSLQRDESRVRPVPDPAPRGEPESTGNSLLFSRLNLAERPFHSLSYPDINYTVIARPTLPPALCRVQPRSNRLTPAPTYTGDPGVRNAYIYPPTPASIGATGAANTFLCQLALSSAEYEQRRPAARRSRRGGCSRFPTPTRTASPPSYPRQRRHHHRRPSTVSNASDSGDPFINCRIRMNQRAWWRICGTAVGTKTYLNNGYPNLVWSGNVTLPTVLNGLGTTCRRPAFTLGSNNTSNPDYSQHPYWRSEMMQKVMNLTTVPDAPVRGLDHDRVLRGQAAGRSADGEREPGDVASHPGFRHPRARDPRLERPDDAVPRLLPGRPNQALRLRRDDPRQLHPGLWSIAR